MSQPLIQIFTYGTLQPEELLKPNATLQQRFCAENMTDACAAIALGCLYHLPLGYPAMTSGSGQVHGSLLSFTDPKILDILDDYENHEPELLQRFFPTQQPGEHDYQRQQIEVFSLDEKSLGLAWVYIMTTQQVHCLQGSFIVSGKWDAKNHPQLNLLTADDEKR